MMRHIIATWFIFLSVGVSTRISAQTDDVKQALYPLWFWEMPYNSQLTFAVGYARRYTRLDTSYATARQQCAWQLLRSQKIAIEMNRKLFSRYDKNRIIYEAVEERIDSSFVATLLEKMVVVDSAVVGNMVFTLAVYPGKTDSKIVAIRVPTPIKPKWIESLPEEEGMIYGVGTSQLYFYAHRSWESAEKDARNQIASALTSRIRGVNLHKDNRQQTWSEAQTAAVLRNAVIVSRWLDIENRQCYALSRMPLK